MRPTSSRYRWFIIVIFFLFMLIHQTDKLLIGPLASEIIGTFKITNTQWGAISSASLLVGSLLYPIWGYLYDRYARPKLVALASLIWGVTTWLSAVAPTFRMFFLTRASTGIDDSSYPGLYSLVSDYFGPEMRGKVYGLLQIAQPLGYLIGMVMALMVAPIIGWRQVFYITGTLGLVIAIAIYFGVKETPRGGSEPELADLEITGQYRFEWAKAKGLFKKRSLLLLFAQGFVGVFPWNVITFFFFLYLEVERGYDENEILFTMAPAVLILAAGYFVGGWLGDAVFKRTKRGRMLVAMGAVLLGAIFLTFTMNVPLEQKTLFFAMLALTALFIPFASPNVISTVYDITLPEIRSTALAVQYFIENGGAALAPLLAGIIADRYSLGTAILVICVSTWVLGALILALTAYLVPRDINQLHKELQNRADLERSLQPLDTNSPV